MRAEREGRTHEATQTEMTSRDAVFELLEATGMPLDDGVEALVALYDAGLVGLSEPSPTMGNE